MDMVDDGWWKMDGSRLEDAISIAPYIRNVVADVRGMGGG